MKYGNESYGSSYLPKLLGTYERELHGCITEIIKMSPALVVDIGAAEGYYAIGLALQLPDTKVVAFKMSEQGRSALHDMACRNNIRDNLTIGTKCEIRDLKQTLADKKGAVIICDVEGYEHVLLDPKAIPDLEDCAILVETHDLLIQGLTQSVIERFVGTHLITKIEQQIRTSKDYPFHTVGTRLLPKWYLNWTVDEGRPAKMSWLWMTPYKRP